MNLFCSNPFCPRFNKAFKNKSGQTRHFINSPGCFQKKLAFAAGTAAANQAVLPPPRKRHGIPLHIEGQLRHTYEDSDVVFTSNKRPALLCRDVVNDSVLGSCMHLGKESSSEENFSSVFEFDDDEDEDVGPVSFMKDEHFLQSEFLRKVSVRRPFPWYYFYADKSATNNDQRGAPPPLLSSSVHCHLSF